MIMNNCAGKVMNAESPREKTRQEIRFIDVNIFQSATFKIRLKHSN